MPLARTNIGAFDSGNGGGGGFGTGPFTTTSFTPASNSLLVVCIAVENVADGTVDPSLTIAGGGLTFTRQKFNESLSGGNDYVGIWTAPVNIAASMTLTFDCGALNIYRYIAHVFNYQGQDPISPIGANGGMAAVNGSTPLTFTLSASPALTSEVVAISIGDGTITITAGTGWTQQFSSTPDIKAMSETRTNSISTTVTWDALNSSSGSGVATSALEIEAALLTPPQLMGSMVM